MAPKRKLRYFFEILHGDFSHQLMIPPKFLKHMPLTPRRQFVLKNSHNNAWHVETRNSAENLFLTGHGWESFVEDNGLKEFEFLVFGYDGRSHFHVNVFDRRTCCKKEPLMKEGKKPEIDRRPRRKGCSGRVLAKRFSLPAKTEKAEQGGDKRTAESALFTSSHPRCIIRMGTSSLMAPFQLKIPTDFGRKYLPETKSSVKLWNWEGRAWEVVYSPRSKKLNGGWKPFARENGLELGDECVLEMVGVLEFRMQVIRSRWGEEGCTKSLDSD